MLNYLNGLTQAQAVLFAGVFGALGAIAASLVANVIGHFLSLRSKDKRKYDEVRRDAYLTFYDAMLALWASFDVVTGKLLVDQKELAIRHEAVRCGHVRAVFFGGSKRAVRAATKLYFGSDHLYFGHKSGASWLEVQKVMVGLGNEFILSVRKELKLPNFDVSLSYDDYVARMEFSGRLKSESTPKQEE